MVTGGGHRLPRAGLGPALHVRRTRGGPFPEAGSEVGTERGRPGPRPGPLGGPQARRARTRPSSKSVDDGPAAFLQSRHAHSLSRSAARGPAAARRRGLVPLRGPRSLLASSHLVWRDPMSRPAPVPAVPPPTPGPHSPSRSTSRSTGWRAPSSRRRGTAGRVLRPSWPDDRRAWLRQEGLLPTARPDRLTSAHWLSLFACWSAAHSRPRPVHRVRAGPAAGPRRTATRPVPRPCRAGAGQEAPSRGSPRA